MENKIIINIGREIGSGGRAVARRLSEIFSIPCYDRELLEMAASRSGMSSELLGLSEEVSRPSFFLGLPPVNLGVFSDSGLSQRSLFGSDSLFSLQSDTIRQLASEGSCIFVGRCADYVLRDDPACLNVFISADMEDRLRRISELRHLTASEAAKVIERTDRQRSAYYNYYTYQTWGQARTYHLCLNSSVLGLEGTAQFIVSFLRASRSR